MSILTSVLLFAAAFLPDDAISLGPLGGSATSVWVDPADADVLLITHPIKGLQRSEDGGVTFAPFGSGLPTDLAPQALTARRAAPAPSRSAAGAAQARPRAFSIVSLSVSRSRAGSTGFLKITPESPSSRLRLMMWSLS